MREGERGWERERDGERGNMFFVNNCCSPKVLAEVFCFLNHNFRLDWKAQLDENKNCERTSNLTLWKKCFFYALF